MKSQQKVADACMYLPHHHQILISIKDKETTLIDPFNSRTKKPKPKPDQTQLEIRVNGTFYQRSIVSFMMMQ